MTQTQARYDEFAEWYEQWSSDRPPLIAAQDGLLPDVTGDRVLDIGCGQGRMCRHLAGLGADVTGVDISAAMLGRARAAGPADITYLHADVTGQLDGAAAGWLVRRLDRASVPSGHRAGREQLAAGTGIRIRGMVALAGRPQSRWRPDPGRRDPPHAIHLPECAD
jgi:SAM-dependent methyltransferase